MKDIKKFVSFLFRDSSFWDLDSGSKRLTSKSVTFDEKHLKYWFHFLNVHDDKMNEWVTEKLLEMEIFLMNHNFITQCKFEKSL